MKTTDAIETIGYRPTWVEINLAGLEHNYKQIRKAISRATGIIACVKADAYGHGAGPVSQRLVSLGVEYLAVASIDEAITLRKEGIKTPILVLGMVLPAYVSPLFKYGITQTVCTWDLAEAISKHAAYFKKQAKIHIKVDTGMGRLGFAYNEAYDLVREIAKLKFLKIEGIFTHFPSADSDMAFTRHQVDIFNKLITRLEKSGIRIPMHHAANSMGILHYKNSHLNFVRPGLILYGLYPKKGLKIDLRPVMSLKTKVVFTKRVSKGEGISYGHSYHTKKDTTIVTLPIGYGDGYPRSLSNKADVLIAGQRFKISGKVCMDHILVDVGDARVGTGDEAVLIGASASERVGAEELARLIDTISYEIVCGIGGRVPRIYPDQGVV